MPEENKESRNDGASAPGGPPKACGAYETLNRELEALHRVRVISTAALLCIFLVYGIFIVRLFMDFEKQVFFEHLVTRFEQIRPELQDAANDVVQNGVKEAMGKVQHVLRQRLPLVREKARSEVSLLLGNTKKHFEKRITDELIRQMDKRVDMVIDNFPELADKELRAKVIVDLHSMARNVITRVLEEDLQAIENNIDKAHYALSEPMVRERIEVLKGDPRLRQKMIGYLLAVVSRQLYEGNPEQYMGAVRQQSLPETPPAPAAADAPAEEPELAKPAADAPAVETDTEGDAR